MGGNPKNKIKQMCNVLANVANPEKIISGLVLKALFTTLMHMPMNASQSNLPKDSLIGALNH